MHPRVALAALILLREYRRGGICPRQETRERIDSLLRPLMTAPLDQPLMSALGLDATIEELEASFPEATQPRAAHLTRVPPSVPC